MEFYGTGRLLQIKMTGEENINVGSSHPKVFFEVNVLKFKIYFFFAVALDDCFYIYERFPLLKVSNGK